MRIRSRIIIFEDPEPNFQDSEMHYFFINNNKFVFLEDPEPTYYFCINNNNFIIN